MVRFSDLHKKGASKEADPDSSVLEEAPQEEETEPDSSVLEEAPQEEEGDPDSSVLEEAPQEKEAELGSLVLEEAPQEKDFFLDAQDWYQRGCQFLEHALERVRIEEKLDLSGGKHLVEEIVQACLRDMLPQELLIKALHAEETESFLTSNPVNVTVFATVMGKTLGLPKERLEELGLAALLHDIGKIRVLEEILYKKATLTDKELAVLRRYPYESFEVLRGLGEEYHYLAECALHVNERLDGSGYPQGLQGDEINHYAQIIGILDIYEALTHKRPHREKLSHFQAVKEIIKTQKQTFSRELLKALLNTFSIFPLHSMVKLNSGAIGRVAKTYEEQPLRPMIEIVMDAQKRRLQVPRALDLREQPVLYVVDAVTEESLNA